MREKFWWLNEESKSMLKRGYLLPGQTVEEKLDKITSYAAKQYDEPGIKEKFLELFERGWCSLSSPIWANFGEDRGLPISCFGTYIPDSMEGIYSSLHEVATETKMGGGTSGYFGDLRPIGSDLSDGGKTSGAMSFTKLFDLTSEVVSQGGVRRGAFAGYIDIEHPEVKNFISIKDRESDLQNVFPAVCIGNKWMEEMIAGDSEKRDLWATILKKRREKGLPYIFFKDNVNDSKPQIYKETDRNIYASNLCSEILLSSNENESFVCCLMSMNLATYDEWKDTNAVRYAVMFLDTVMEDFINKVKDIPSMRKAYNFAKNQRALGLGVLGFHSLLQQRMIDFESFDAQLLNSKIFKQIHDQAYRASEELGDKYGYAPIFDEVETSEVKRRNTTLLAIAPTTSSSAILGQVSPSIEPYASNYFVAGLAKGSFTRKNKELEKLLESKDKNTDEVWRSILQHKGSVLHLDFLTDEEKAVFKTFQEISPLAIVRLASGRQKFIDQGQSLNFKIPNAMDIKDINKIHIEAWKLGLKTLYYQRGTSVAKETVLDMMQCKACEA